MSMLVPREDATLLAVVVSLIFAVLCGYIKIFPYWMKSLSELYTIPHTPYLIPHTHTPYDIHHTPYPSLSINVIVHKRHCP
jgi:hypothetical protein